MMDCGAWQSEKDMIYPRINLLNDTLLLLNLLQ